MPDWTDNFHALNKELNGVEPPKSFTLKVWEALKGFMGMAKKEEEEENPELVEVIPEGPDDDLVDQACTDNQKIIEKAAKAKLAAKEAAEADAQKKSDDVQHAETEEQPNKPKQDDADDTQKTEPKKPLLTPTIDDLISNIQNEEPQKPKIEIPAELLPKKKVWTPDQGVTKKEAAAVKPIVGGVTPGMKQQQQSDFDDPFQPTQPKMKLPPGFISGPNPAQMATDAQPFIFKLEQTPANPVPELNHYKLIKVYATPIQKAQALIGVETLHPEFIYLWFDCFDGHAGNTTVGTIRVYMVKAYDEFACKEIKPNKMIDLPKDIQHVILTAASAPQMDNLEFLEDHMPIKEKP